MINFFGPEFLFWYIIFLALAVCAGMAARSVCLSVSDGEPIEQATFDSYDIACLAEGPKRAFLAAVATLSHKNIISVGTVTRTVECNVQGDLRQLTAIEQAIVTEVKRKTETLDKIYKAVEFQFAEVEDKLKKYNLLANDTRYAYSRWIPFLIVMLLPITIGVPKMIHGASEHKPVVFLFFLIILSFGVACFFLRKGNRRTSRGDEVLKTIKDDCRTLYYNLQSHPSSLSSADMALAYGLFGGVALGVLNPFVQARAAMSPTGKCSGCGSGCGSASCASGGGGGCGGGCGGCGGGCGG